MNHIKIVLAVTAFVMLGVSARAQSKQTKQKVPTKQVETHSVHEAKPNIKNTEAPVQREEMVPVQQTQVVPAPQQETKPMQVVPIYQNSESVEPKALPTKKSSGTITEKASKGEK